MLKGKFTDAQGHTDTAAYLNITGVRIDFTTGNAAIICSIFKNQTAYQEGKAPTGVFQVMIKPKAYEVKNGETVVYTVPAFDDLLGTEKLADSTYNPVVALYGLIQTMPDFKDFEVA